MRLLRLCQRRYLPPAKALNHANILPERDGCLQPSPPFCTRFPPCRNDRLPQSALAIRFKM